MSNLKTLINGHFITIPTIYNLAVPTISTTYLQQKLTKRLRNASNDRFYHSTDLCKLHVPRYNECILFAVTRRVFLKPFRATVPLQRFSYHGFERVKLLIKILKFQAYSLISKNTEPLETKVFISIWNGSLVW